ncbi:MAG: sugar kinase [Coprobacillus sp.]
MKILAFGEVMMRMMPSDYKTLSQVNELEFLYTGTGVNILSGLYQMGENVFLTTCLPNNAVGKSASSHLRKLGIQDNFVKYKGNHIGIYFLEKGIGNRASQVTYLNRKDSSFGQSELSDYDFSCLDGMDVIHICGISLALNEKLREVAFEFVKAAKQRNIKVIFDCNFRPSLWDNEDKNKIREIYEEMLTLSDVVFAGYKDATLLLGMKVDMNLSYSQQLQDLMIQMCHKYHIEAILGTNRLSRDDKDYLQGYIVKDGIMTLSQEYLLTVYDRVGGGDGFAAGGIYAYFHHMDFQELVDYATVSGVLAHTTYGDSPIVSKEDIFEFIKNGKNDIKR